MPQPLVENENNQAWLEEYITKHLIPDDKMASDKLGTVSPHYYGIIDYEIIMVENGHHDYIQYYDIDACHSMSPMQLLENLIEENEFDPEEYMSLLETDNFYYHMGSWITDNIKFAQDNDDNWKLIGEPDETDIIAWLDEYIDSFGLEDQYNKNYLIDKPYLVQNLMFLTQEEAQAHLDANYYHYNQNAHTFCMHPWRAPDTNKLLTLLKLIDFEKSAIVFKENTID